MTRQADTKLQPENETLADLSIKQKTLRDTDRQTVKWTKRDG